MPSFATFKLVANPPTSRPRHETQQPASRDTPANPPADEPMRELSPPPFLSSLFSAAKMNVAIKALHATASALKKARQ
ncbi:hypothetical protein LY78DRAFT_687505 [Colletotrichum sublineola]|nr:hypothetical protein LY78DRAFT_687505 [Colletotrichum sublineola]